MTPDLYQMDQRTVKRDLALFTLETQADGRRYAIAVLTMAQDTDHDEANCSRKVDDVLIRTAPQLQDIKDFVDEIYCHGSEEARKGFFAVITDAMVIAGNSPPFEPRRAAEYAELERKGLIEDWS
jgi:hypothetical protein